MPFGKVYDCFIAKVEGKLLLWYSVDNKEKWIRRDGSGKGKNVYSYSFKLFISGKFENVALDCKEERGFSFVYSDRNEFKRITVMTDVSLS